MQLRYVRRVYHALIATRVSARVMLCSAREGTACMRHVYSYRGTCRWRVPDTCLFDAAERERSGSNEYRCGYRAREM